MKQNQFNLTSLERFLDQYAQNGWAYTDQIFQTAFLQSLASECHNLHSSGHLKKAAIGHLNSKNINAEIRGDYTLWLEDAPESQTIKTFTKFLTELQTLLNREFFAGLKKFESHFAFYPPGTNYVKHIDNHKGSGARKVTFILYLNENWQKGNGGELTLYSPNVDNQVLCSLEPVMGRFVLFLSELFPHQVEKSFSNRLSLTGWYRDDNI